MTGLTSNSYGSVYVTGVRRFKLCFLRALRFQQRAGKITAGEAKVFHAAIVSKELNDYGRTYAHELCIDLSKTASELFDNLADWWSRLFQWLIENWDLVLKTALSLLIMLI